VYADALRTISPWWSSIQTAFTNFPLYFESYVESFPGCQGSTDFKQLCTCGAVVAEITKGLVMLEHVPTNARASFDKTKQSPRESSLSEGWQFRPTDACIGDVVIETDDLLLRIAHSLEVQWLALSRLNKEDESLDAKTIERPRTAWL
jgi:hypothetical protein